MTTVKTLASPPCYPISKKMIRTSSRRAYIYTRPAVTRQYELQGLRYQRHGAKLILSLPALHFQIYDIHSRPEHHHCSNANSQPSTYHASLMLYRCSHFPRPVETTMFLNQRPVEITTFLNTKRLHLEVAKRFMEAIVFTMTPWPIISDEKYSMVDKAWKLAIQA